MSAGKYRRIIAVDFDGTLAVTYFPKIIEPIEGTIRYCREQQKNGAILILWTCRVGKNLQDAVEWCADQGLYFDYINENVKENIKEWGNDCRKIFAHEYIDDKATNPKREKQWEARLRRALMGRGKEAALASFIGMAAGIAGVILLLYFIVAF